MNRSPWAEIETEGHGVVDAAAFEVWVKHEVVMRVFPFRSSRMIVLLLCLSVLLGLVGSLQADPKPLTKEEQDKVDKAIEKGATFLKRSQMKEGDWPWKMRKDSFFVGQCALPAYALLEAGVPADDPVIQKASEYIRARVPTNDQTYELSLAILFFDRLADPRDKKLIQTLALRLIAGQHHTGGWAYSCPVLNDESEQTLLAALKIVSKEMRAKGKTREQALAGMEVPPMLQSLSGFRSERNLQWQEPLPKGNAIREWARGLSLTARTDNSNTQFAILGLWTAQRYDVPMEASFELLVGRFERTQDFPSGSWWYSIDGASGPPHYSPAMICVGLKGLAIGRGLKLATPGSPGETQKDVHVLKGLVALSRHIGKPSGRMDKQRPLPDYYFLWSVERVARLFNLEAINGKDWYRWGAEALVTNQAKNGAWSESASIHTEWNKNRPINYKAALNTAFALLFLKRSHPMKELTPKLPFTAKELNEGIAQLRPRDKFPLRPVTAPTEGKSRDQPTTTPSRSEKPGG